MAEWWKSYTVVAQKVNTQNLENIDLEIALHFIRHQSTIKITILFVKVAKGR